MDKGTLLSLAKQPYLLTIELRRQGTLIRMLLDAHPQSFASAVSHTTRQPRPGEAKGKHYYLVSVSEFSCLISQGALVEHTLYDGHHYGTSRMTMEEQEARGLMVILDIEMNGVKQMKSNLGANVRYTIIKPPSIDTLEARLRDRGTERENDIEKRLEQASKELEFAEHLGVHDKIIVNDDLLTAFNELDAFLLK